MTPRETYLRALKRQPVDTLIWAPNIDQWYGVNTAAGTVPEEYRRLSCNDVIRAAGGALWRRVNIIDYQHDPSVKVEVEEIDDLLITYFRTPVGEVRTVQRTAPDASRTRFTIEHRVKSLDDLRVLHYLIEATHLSLHTDEYEEQLRDVGEDGIILTCLPETPFIHFAKSEVGYLDAFYLLEDAPCEAEDIIAAFHRHFLDAYRLAAQGPCEVVSCNDNMDQLTCPPQYFTRYAVPYYHDTREILHAGGKLAQGHWCGQVHQLLPLIPGCGLDIIEAMTPKPMSKVDMVEAMDLLEGKIAVQGGIPSIYMCESGCSRAELEEYLDWLLDNIGHRIGFVLGMGDNVPCNADFARVKLVSEKVAAYNQRRKAAVTV